MSFRAGYMTIDVRRRFKPKSIVIHWGPPPCAEIQLVLRSVSRALMARLFTPLDELALMYTFRAVLSPVRR